MSAIIEDKTGYASFLICDHKETTVFYRTGTEMAIYHKAENQLRWSDKVSEAERKEFGRAIEQSWRRLAPA